MGLSRWQQAWSRAARRLEEDEATGRLGDFIRSSRIIPLSALAIGIGAVSAFVALILLRLIGLVTNLFFYQRWDTALVSPAERAAIEMSASRPTTSPAPTAGPIIAETIGLEQLTTL